MAKRPYSIDLSTHLAECDANYLRLGMLFGDMDKRDIQECQLITESHSASLRLRVLERCPYTSIVQISQQAVDRGLDFDLPAATITLRVYHDARSVEVVEIQNEDRFRPVYEYPNLKMRQQDEKAQVNRFLGEYLSFCIQQGVKSADYVDPSLQEPADR